MIRKHFKMILSICTFLVLFQTSSTQIQFPFSLDLFDDDSSSSSSGGSTSSTSTSSTTPKNPISQLAEKVAELNPYDRKILVTDFLQHLHALSKLQEDERKIEVDMEKELENVPKFEFDAVSAIKKFRKAIDKGRKALDRVFEKRANRTSNKGSEIVRNYQDIWARIELKKRDEAKSALETIDNILSSFGKSIVGTVDDQLKTLNGIQKFIEDRKKKIDEESGEIRKHLASIHTIKIPIRTVTRPQTPAADPSPSFLFDEKDVKEIREIYDIWMERLPKIDIPETKHLLKKIEESGMSMPLFCKTLAESHVIRNKGRACEKKGDIVGLNIWLKTLEQPNYKKVEQIIEESPPPSLETVANEVRKRFFV